MLLLSALVEWWKGFIKPNSCHASIWRCRKVMAKLKEAFGSLFACILKRARSPQWGSRVTDCLNPTGQFPYPWAKSFLMVFLMVFTSSQSTHIIIYSMASERWPMRHTDLLSLCIWGELMEFEDLSFSGKTEYLAHEQHSVNLCKMNLKKIRDEIR